MSRTSRDDAAAELFVSLLDISSDRSPVLDTGVAHLDLVHGIVQRDGHPEVRLTTRERALVAYMVKRAGHDLSREELLAEVFGYAPSVASRTLDTTIARLRSKLEVDASAPVLIQTVHGVGYRWGAPRVTAPPRDLAGTTRVRIGAAHVDLARGRIHRPGCELSLTSAERLVLAKLAAADGRPVAAEDLTTSSRIRHVAAARVARTVSRLRRKLGLHGAGAPLRTVPGAGYALDIDRTMQPALADRVSRAIARQVAPRVGCDRWVIYTLEGEQLVEVGADDVARTTDGHAGTAGIETLVVLVVPTGARITDSAGR